MKLKELIKKFDELPTVPDSEVTLDFIDWMLTQSITYQASERLEYASIFSELIDKLVFTYADLRSSQKLIIMDWVALNWDNEEVEYIDLLITIAINTDSMKAKKLFEEKMKSIVSFEIKEIIKEALLELK